MSRHVTVQMSRLVFKVRPAKAGSKMSHCSWPGPSSLTKQPSQDPSSREVTEPQWSSTKGDFDTCSVKI